MRMIARATPNIITNVHAAIELWYLAISPPVSARVTMGFIITPVNRLHPDIPV